MIKIRKRLGILLLCLTVLFSVIPGGVVCAEDVLQETGGETEEEMKLEEPEKETQLEKNDGSDRKKGEERKELEEAKEEPEKPEETEEPETEEPEKLEETEESETEEPKKLEETEEPKTEETEEPETEDPEKTEDAEAEDPEKSPAPGPGGTEEKADAQTELQEEPGQEGAEEKRIISFYAMKQNGGYCLLEKRETDAEGRAVFPDAPDVEGFFFDGWETEDFKRVDEEETFAESCSLYAVYMRCAEEDAAPAAVKARAGSLGIDVDRPRAGQQNMYGYTGSEQSFTVRVSGYYSITAAGGKGGSGYINNSLADDHHFDSYVGSGESGESRTATYYIPAGTVLVVHVGNAGGSATGSEGGAAGWNDGQKGNFTHYKCDDTSNHNAKAATGGGGGSSYVKINGTKLISGAGGGAGESAAIACEHTQRKAYAVSGGGSSNYVTSLGGVTYRDGASSGWNNGSGYVSLTVVELLPAVSLSADPKEWTNGEVTLTARAASEGEGLEGDFISWEADENGNDVWTDALTFTVSQNGTYICKIRDKKGNEAQASIEIKNIDRICPEVEIIPDTEEWTRGGVVLAASGDDAQETGAYGKSGLQEAAYLWGAGKDGGSVEWETEEAPDGPDGTGKDPDPGPQEAWTKEDTRTVSQNGTYACRVRDRVGNVTEVSYRVKNIDRTAPSISFTRPDGWHEGVVTVTWSGKDLQPDGSAGAGLHDEAYSFDGTNFGKECAQQIPGPGTYRIWVRDRLGNTAEYGIYIGYDEKPAPEDKEIPGGDSGDSGGGGNGGGGGPKEPAVPVKQPDVPETEEGGGGGSIIMPVLPMEPVEERQETVVKLQEIAQNPVTLPEMPVLQRAVLKDTASAENSGRGRLTGIRHTLSNNGKNAVYYAAQGTAAASGGIMLYFILFYAVRSAGILAMDMEKEYVYIGRRRIVKRRGMYQVYIDSYLYSKADTEYFQIKPGKRFIKKYRGKMMAVKHGDKKIQVVIDDEIKVKIPSERTE